MVLLIELGDARDSLVICHYCYKTKLVWRKYKKNLGVVFIVLSYRIQYTQLVAQAYRSCGRTINSGHGNYWIL